MTSSTGGRGAGRKSWLASGATAASNQANPRSPGALRYIDAVLGALLDAGLDEREAARRYRSLIGLILGVVLVDSADVVGARAERDEPIDAYFARQATPEALPSLHRALPALLDIDCAPEFGQELDYFVAGLRTSAPASGTAQSSSSSSPPPHTTFGAGW